MKDNLKYAFLKRLAETLDFSKTKKDFPGMSDKDIQSFLFKLADTFKPAEVVTIYVDGASRGNPGDAGIGIFIKTEDGRALVKTGRYIGKTTNNVAEYHALIAALQEAKSIGAKAVKIFADSELMVKQINAEYKVRSPGLLPLYKEAHALLMTFNRYDIIHINREENTEADRLANHAIDTMAR